MAVKIRLKRMGKIRSPHYRIVVMDARKKRDGRAIEELGIYHPKNDPSVIRIDSERVLYWLGVGAQPTETVVSLLKKTGDWQKFTGDATPAGVEPQPEPADKLARFNAALAEADDEPKSGAITGRKKGKTDEADEPAEAKAEEPAEAKADEAADAAAAETTDEA